MIINSFKWFLIAITVLGTLSLLAEGKESEEELSSKSHKLKKEIALLEDKAARLQFIRGSTEETKNIYAQIDQLHLELNEIDDKLDKLSHRNLEK